MMDTPVCEVWGWNSTTHLTFWQTLKQQIYITLHTHSFSQVKIQYREETMKLASSEC